MKKLILLALLALMGGVSYAQTSIQGRQVDVRAFGAKCDGTTNDQTAIAAAITAVTSTGGVVNLPDGTCVVTGLTVPGGVTLQGKGKYVTTVKSNTNGVILNLVQGSGAFTFFGPKILDLAVDGSDSGASQIGIQATDATYVRDIVVEDVYISDCGSHGLSVGLAFSSSFKNIYSNSNQGYNFFINSPNMPTNYYYGLYSGDISSAAPAGYRIKQGTFTCWSCNGINTVGGSTGYWAVIGGKNGDIDGDTSAYYATANFQDCNIEGAKTAGVLNYPGSVPSFRGLTTFVGLSASSGSYIAIDYDTDASLSPENSQRGYIDDTVIFSNSPASFYSNSQPIRADGQPPVSVHGRGPLIAGGGAAGMIGTYYNTATSRVEQLTRDDGYAPSVALTASASFTNPGARAYRMNCASPCTLTLPSPVYYENGNELVTVYNLSSTGTNVTIAANGGGTVNGSTYVLNVQGQSVQLYPDFTSLNWRLIGQNDTLTSAQIGFGSSSNLLSSSSNLTYDGTTVLNQRAGGNPYFAANDTTNGITTRFGPLAGAPDRAIIGTTSNHPLGFWMNSAERWTINTSGDFAPGAASMYSIGSATLPVLNTTLNGKLFWNGTTVFDNYGTGSPEGVITAAVGSVYRRTNGAAGTTLYVKESGSGNTGWSAIATAASGVSSVNGLVGALTIATGTTGADFNVSASGTTVTLNLPDASASVRGAMTTGTQTFAGAKSFTSVGTFNPGTTPANAILIDINALGTAGTRDSNWLVMRGRSNDGATHLTEWKEFVDVTTNAGGSTWTLQSRIDAAAFGTLFSVSDAGAVTGGDFLGASFTTNGGAVLDDDINAVTGFTIAGAATSGQYLRGNGTRFVNSAIQAGDLPATVVLTSAANTYTAGQKQTFSPNGTSAGFNVGSVSADPSSVSNGDCWYQSTANEYRCRINGSTVALGSGSGGSVTGSGTSGKLAKFTGASSIGDSIVSESGAVLTVTGDLRPEADNTRDLGSTSLRWKTLNVGPGSVVVHNDATNTLKTTLGFSGSTAQLTTDAATPLQIKTGSNTGLFLNTNGTIGINLATSTSGNVDLRQLANGDTMLNMRRTTDTSPTGNFLNFQNAAGANIFIVDVTGTMVAGTIPGARIASGTVAAANGGTGLDTSASSGMPLITTGTWSIIGTTGTGNGVRGTSPTIAGGAITALTSFGLRSSGSGAFDLTLANTENLTAGRTLTFTLNDAARTINLGGNLTTAAAFTTSGANALTLTTTGSTNVTLPTTGTLGTLAGSETLTNKTLTASSNVLGGVTMTLGSDANGDTYYRSSGVLTRLAIGSTSAELLTTSSSVPSWKRKTHNILAYGAVCDGSTDDRTAVQAMFDAMVTGDKATFEGCKTIKLASQTTIGNGSGTYGSTSSATASTVTDIEIDGANVTVTWTGSSGGPFKINGPIYRVTFQNFRIEMGGNAGIALDLNHTRLSVFRKLYINANADYGFRLRAYPVWTGGDGANGNTIESVWINTTTAGGKGFDIGDTDYCSGCSTHLDPAQNNFSNIRARFDTGVGTWLASSVGMRLNFTDAGVCTDCIFAAATAVSVNVPTGTNSYPSAYMFNNLSAQGTTSFNVTGTWTAVEKFGFYNYLTGDSQTVPTDSNTFGTTSKGITWGLALDTGYITGLQLTWNSTSQIQIGTGVAQIQSTGRLLNVSSALTINPSLGASTWYYCYVYDNSGTPAGECVTTAPASAWFGTARSKTSDTTRRYIGAIRTNGSSQLYVFYHNPQSGYVQWLEDTTASPFRAISGGTATTETSVDCTAVAPATARQIQLRTINTSTPTGNVFIRASTGGANVLTVRVNADLITPATVTTGQLFYYLYNVAPSGAFYGDVIGYFDNR